MEERVYTILRQYMENQTVVITPDKSLISDLGIESIDLINIVGCFEDEFDIEIPDNDQRCFITVEDIIQYLSQRK